MGNFGWSLPPGVSHRMIDEAMGFDEPCEMCGYDVDHCVCPECPVCDTYGDPACYSKHGLIVSKEQIDGLKAMHEAIEHDRLVDDELYKSYLEDDIFSEEKS